MTRKWWFELGRDTGHFRSFQHVCERAGRIRQRGHCIAVRNRMAAEFGRCKLDHRQGILAVGGHRLAAWLATIAMLYAVTSPVGQATVAEVARYTAVALLPSAIAAMLGASVGAWRQRAEDEHGLV